MSLKHTVSIRTTSKLSINKTTISSDKIDKPIITTPIDGSSLNTSPIVISITTPSIELTTGDTHVSTDWEIALDPTFNEVVIVSHEDTVNKLTKTIILLTNNYYYIRARFRTEKYISDWSDTIKILYMVEEQGSSYIPGSIDTPTVVSTISPFGVALSNFTPLGGFPGIHTSTDIEFYEIVGGLKGPQITTLNINSGNLTTIDLSGVSELYPYRSDGFIINVKYGSSVGVDSSWSSDYTYPPLNLNKPTFKFVRGSTKTIYHYRYTYSSNDYSTTALGNYISTEWKFYSDNGGVNEIAIGSNSFDNGTFLFGSLISTITNFYVKYRYLGQYGYTPWSDLFNIDLLTLTAPAHVNTDVASTTITFSDWNSVWGGNTVDQNHQSSDWEFYSGSDSTNFISGTGGNVFSLTNIDYTAYLPGTYIDTDVYVRVRYNGNRGAETQWSAKVLANLLVNYTAPVFVANDTNVGTITFSDFISIAPATHTHNYSDWEFFDDQIMTNTLGTQYNSSDLTSINVRSLFPTRLDVWVRVRYTSIEGITSPWSDVVQCVLDPILTAPVFVSYITSNDWELTYSNFALSDPTNSFTHGSTDWAFYDTQTSAIAIKIDNTSRFLEVTSTDNHVPSRQSVWVEVRYISTTGVASDWSIRKELIITNPNVAPYLLAKDNVNGTITFANINTVMHSEQTHQYTDWEFFSDQAMTNMLGSSYNDTTDLYTKDVKTLYPSEVEIWTRCRYHSVQNQQTPWSLPERIKLVYGPNSPHMTTYDGTTGRIDFNPYIDLVPFGQTGSHSSSHYRWYSDSAGTTFISSTTYSSNLPAGGLTYIYMRTRTPTLSDVWVNVRYNSSLGSSSSYSELEKVKLFNTYRQPVLIDNDPTMSTGRIDFSNWSTVGPNWHSHASSHYRWYSDSAGINFISSITYSSNLPAGGLTYIYMRTRTPTLTDVWVKVRYNSSINISSPYSDVKKLHLFDPYVAPVLVNNDPTMITGRIDFSNWSTVGPNWHNHTSSNYRWYSDPAGNTFISNITYISNQPTGGLTYIYMRTRTPTLSDVWVKVRYDSDVGLSSPYSNLEQLHLFDPYVAPVLVNNDPTMITGRIEFSNWSTVGPNWHNHSSSHYRWYSDSAGNNFISSITYSSDISTGGLTYIYMRTRTPSLTDVWVKVKYNSDVGLGSPYSNLEQLHLFDPYVAPVMISIDNITSRIDFSNWSTVGPNWHNHTSSHYRWYSDPAGISFISSTTYSSDMPAGGLTYIYMNQHTTNNNIWVKVKYNSDVGLGSPYSDLYNVTW